MTVADLLEPTLLKRISRYEVVARSVVEGTVTGLHKSPFKGSSVEFTQHRPYVPGDELKRLDWKVMARTERTYVKEYEEETNLKAHIYVDVSGSMGYSSGGMTKYEYSARLAGALAYLMLSQTDSVGLAAFDTEVREFIAARSKKGQLRNIVQVLATARTSGESDLPGVLNDAADATKRRGLFIVISDFFAEVDEILKALSHLRHRRHEVIVFQVLDRAEIDFPFRRWTRFDNLEMVDDFRLLDPASFRRLYLERFNAHREGLKAGCVSRAIDFVPFVTDAPLGESLSDYLALRMKRGRAH
jgi:uncharacterized protein (DUF58 family)